MVPSDLFFQVRLCKLYQGRAPSSLCSQRIPKIIMTVSISRTAGYFLTRSSFLESRIPRGVRKHIDMLTKLFPGWENSQHGHTMDIATILTVNVRFSRLDLLQTTLHSNPSTTANCG